MVGADDSTELCYCQISGTLPCTARHQALVQSERRSKNVINDVYFYFMPRNIEFLHHQKYLIGSQ